MVRQPSTTRGHTAHFQRRGNIKRKCGIFFPLFSPTRYRVHIHCRPARRRYPPPPRTPPPGSNHHYRCTHALPTRKLLYTPIEVCTPSFDSFVGFFFWLGKRIHLHVWCPHDWSVGERIQIEPCVAEQYDTIHVYSHLTVRIRSFSSSFRFRHVLIEIL